MHRTRRRAVLLGLAIAVGLVATPTMAEDTNVPISLQAELFAKVAGYDKNLSTRANDKVRVLVVSKKNDAESKRMAGQMVTALGTIGDIGGISKEVSSLVFSTAKELAAHCKDQKISIAYFASGLGSDIAAIASALEELSILSVAGVPSYVPDGIVLGASLVEGRPKLLLNLPQARKQQVKLRSDVMALMKVYQ